MFANQRPEHKSRWSSKIPVRVQAMVLAGDTLLLAGPPDVAPEDDPYAAFEGRMGAKFWAISVSDGKRLAEYELVSPPVFDGMAAADGRLYLSGKDGSITCFASP